MDRSLVEMKRSRCRSANRDGIGTTVKKQTTRPHNGTVADLAHGCFMLTNAGDHGEREPNKSRAVPMQLVCTRRTMPAADVTRNRPSQRPFANRDTQHPRPTRSAMT
jgi:hypothetical protein